MAEIIKQDEHVASMMHELPSNPDGLIDAQTGKAQLMSEIAPSTRAHPPSPTAAAAASGPASRETGARAAPDDESHSTGSHRRPRHGGAGHQRSHDADEEGLLGPAQDKFRDFVTSPAFRAAVQAQTNKQLAKHGVWERGGVAPSWRRDALANQAAVRVDVAAATDPEDAPTRRRGALPASAARLLGSAELARLDAALARRDAQRAELAPRVRWAPGHQAWDATGRELKLVFDEVAAATDARLPTPKSPDRCALYGALFDAAPARARGGRA
ncbi:hypothetical protein JL720_14425 [Aureococcus anophagefferens]|nr:hypothetical protein JL720_14425 [Aureococcus anophagefferens]